jgi:hypothetical protein
VPVFVNVAVRVWVVPLLVMFSVLKSGLTPALVNLADAGGGVKTLPLVMVGAGSRLMGGTPLISPERITLDTAIGFEDRLPNATNANPTLMRLALVTLTVVPKRAWEKTSVPVASVVSLVMVNAGQEHPDAQLPTVMLVAVMMLWFQLSCRVYPLSQSTLLSWTATLKVWPRTPSTFAGHPTGDVTLPMGPWTQMLEPVD